MPQALQAGGTAIAGRSVAVRFEFPMHLIRLRKAEQLCPKVGSGSCRIPPFFCRSDGRTGSPAPTFLKFLYIKLSHAKRGDFIPKVGRFCQNRRLRSHTARLVRRLPIRVNLNIPLFSSFLVNIHVFACIFLGSGGFMPPKIAGIIRQPTDCATVGCGHGPR